MVYWVRKDHYHCAVGLNFDEPSPAEHLFIRSFSGVFIDTLEKLYLFALVILEHQQIIGQAA